MRYHNPRTRLTLDLSKLTENEKAFYERAAKAFRRNMEWFSFDQFVFSPRSPIYGRHRSHLEVLRDPLYLALRDMWVELGVRQGMVAPSKSKSSRRRGASPTSRRAA